MTNIPHEHDEHGNCIPPEGYAQLEWRYSGWDMVGIAATTVGGIFAVIGQGLNLFARECTAIAAWSRTRADYQDAVEEQQLQDAYQAHQRAAMADDLERISGMDHYWLSPDAPQPEEGDEE